MTYKINGTEFNIQPTTGAWRNRRQVGLDGNGRPIYSSVREFLVRWQLATPAHFNQLQGFYDSVLATGTSVVSLPKYGDSTYVFEDYTGCIVREPRQSQFFNEHNTSVSMLITKIRT